MQAIYVPSIPPASPYEAYLLLLVIPFFFRLTMVLPPLFDIISKYGGDAKWFVARIRQIRIKGLSLLIMNEILALTLPFILALYARTRFDPVGWPDWDTTPDVAIWLLISFAVLWLYLDLLRVARTRRLLRAVSEQNRFIAKAAVEVAAGARTALDYLRMLSPLDMHSDIQAADDIMEGRVDPNEEQEEETSISRLGRMVKDRAILAAETVSEVIRGKAEEASEKLDAKIEEGVHNHAGTSLFLLMRDIVMSLAPLAILILLQQHW
jgi:hypothetical protein